MADEVSIDVQGIAELQRTLSQFSDRLAERVQRVALRQGANFMLKKIRDAAPVSTKGSQEKDNTGRGVYTHFPPGRLKRAIKIKNSKINTLRNNGVVGMFITIYPGKKRNDQKGAWYGKFVENGYNTGSKHTGGVQSTTTRHTRTLRSGRVARYSRTAHYSQGGQRTLRRDYRMSSSTRRYAYRSVGTGRDIPGRHFVLDTFNATKVQALNMIITASESAARQIVQSIGLRSQ